MLRLKSDLLEVLLAATSGKLGEVQLEWDRCPALGVVMAAAGYPLAPKKGDLVTGLPQPQDISEDADAVVFHAGTVLEGEQIRTSGGRVLCVTALADSIKLAQARAYDVARGIHFDGAQYRRDIGWRAIKTNRP